MNTLLFTLEYPPGRGGVANYYGNLVKYWPEPEKIFVLNNSQNSLIKNWLWPRWLPALLFLRKKIKEEDINYILVGQILPLGTAVFLYSKFKKIEYGVILHGLDFSLALGQPRKRWLSKKILEGAKDIICANSYTAELVRKFFKQRGGEKIKIVNPGVDGHATCDTQTRAKIEAEYCLAGKLILLTVGRLVKRKGVDMVLKSLPKVLPEIPNLFYVILGAGPELKDIEDCISELKLEKNVLIINQADDEEKNVWYTMCDIFIMPARNINGDFEGFGIVYLEANLAGKPVIAGRSGGVRDAVIDGENGLLVDPENTDEIARVIIKLGKDQKLRKELGERGKKRALKKFNWKKQVEKIFNMEKIMV